MAGIYLHIPFCKKKCNYCNFFSVASLKNKNSFLKALNREIELQKNYLQNQQVKTIYFGGGTPSLLGVIEINNILDLIYKYHQISKQVEITLECNPDDLNKQKIKELNKTAVNRLSLGVQSFFNEDLKYLNRTHNNYDVEKVIKNSQDSGFENLTIDLIYGMPTLSNFMWEKNLDKFFSFNIPHLSAYSLTVEQKTILYHQIKKQKLISPDENKSIEQFKILINKASSNNFIHYEISNFSKEGYFSKHNSSYWLGKHYLGLGPSANSYNGISRQWNVSNVSKYIQLKKENDVIDGKEYLSKEQAYNEYILTSLRTIWGCDTNHIKSVFGQKYSDYFINSSGKFISNKTIIKKRNKYFLSNKGKLFADGIAAEMFFG